jgi:hypothetical protein
LQNLNSGAQFPQDAKEGAYINFKVCATHGTPVRKAEKPQTIEKQVHARCFAAG